MVGFLAIAIFVAGQISPVHASLLDRFSRVQMRALQALDSHSELMFALCRHDYTRLRRRLDVHTHGQTLAIQAREQEASACKLQAMWRGWRVRAAHKMQREAT